MTRRLTMDTARKRKNPGIRSDAVNEKNGASVAARPGKHQAAFFAFFDLARFGCVLMTNAMPLGSQVFSFST